MQQMLNIFILRMLGIGYFSATYHANSDSHANHAIPSFSFAARIENHWGRSDLPLQCIVFWTVFFWWLQELATSHKLHSGMKTKDWLPCQLPCKHCKSLIFVCCPRLKLCLHAAILLNSSFLLSRAVGVGHFSRTYCANSDSHANHAIPQSCLLPESKIIEVDPALPLQCIVC